MYFHIILYLTDISSLLLDPVLSCPPLSLQSLKLFHFIGFERQGENIKDMHGPYTQVVPDLSTLDRLFLKDVFLEFIKRSVFSIALKKLMSVRVDPDQHKLVGLSFEVVSVYTPRMMSKKPYTTLYSIPT